MYILKESTQFKKDLKKVLKKNKIDLEITFEVLEILQLSEAEGISKEMKPHKLKGNYKNNWECHIKPDLLIIWFQIEENFTIKLVRIGSHSELFK
jgi:mRNA interferase YafQ